MDKFTGKTLGGERKYTGKIISVDLLDIELPDGRQAKREVIRHGNAEEGVRQELRGKKGRNDSWILIVEMRRSARRSTSGAVH